MSNKKRYSKDDRHRIHRTGEDVIRELLAEAEVEASAKNVADIAHSVYEDENSDDYDDDTEFFEKITFEKHVPKVNVLPPFPVLVILVVALLLLPVLANKLAERFSPYALPSLEETPR